MNFSKLVSVHRFVAAVLLAFGLLQATANADVAANVHFVSGLVNGQQPGQAQRALAKGDNIFSRDHIETSANGRIQMRFTDGGLVSLMPNTSFSVEEYQLDAASEEDSSLVFSMVRGGLRTVTGSIGRTHHENYQLRTPVGTLGIRGTEYIAVLDPPTVLHVHVGVGRVVLGNEHGSLEVPAGRSARMAVDSAPVFTEDAPRFLANAPITADWVQGYDIGSVTQDPYVVMVSYDLPIAGARHLARQIGELPPPGDAPVQPPVSEPQPVPEPIPEPEPGPEPEPEPEPIEPPSPEPEPEDDDELEPTPVPVPTPPVTPPPTPGPYTSTDYSGILIGDIFSGGEVSFDSNGRLLSFSSGPVEVLDGRYFSTMRSVAGTDVPDVAIGEYFMDSTSAPDYYLLGAGSVPAFTPNMVLSYSLPSTGGMHIGQFFDTENSPARLDKFSVNLREYGSTQVEYDVEMVVSKSDGSLSYEASEYGSAVPSGGNVIHVTVGPSASGSIVKKEASQPDDPCTTCSLSIAGAFGQDSETLGVRYALEEHNDVVVSGAAILEGSVGIYGTMQSFHASWNPDSNVPVIELGSTSLDMRLDDGEMLGFEQPGQHRAKSAGLDWTQGVGIALGHNGLPFALGGATPDTHVEPEHLAGELKFSFYAANGVVLDESGAIIDGTTPDLTRLDLTLSNLSTAPMFSLDMEVGVGSDTYIAKQDDSLSLTYPVDTWAPFTFGLQSVGTSAPESAITKGGDPCPSCSLDIRGVFSQDAQHVGTVYQLEDGTIRTIQGAAILQRN